MTLFDPKTFKANLKEKKTSKFNLSKLNTTFQIYYGYFY